jgi:hypothetical protein
LEGNGGALKAQTHDSPRQRPGITNHQEICPEGAKQKLAAVLVAPFQGAKHRLGFTQGVALGCHGSGFQPAGVRPCSLQTSKKQMIFLLVAWLFNCSATTSRGNRLDNLLRAAQSQNHETRWAAKRNRESLLGDITRHD